MENTIETKEVASSKSKKPLNVWMVATIIFLAISIVLGCLLAFPEAAAKLGLGGATKKSSGSAQAVAEKAVQYIQNNFDKSITLNKAYDEKLCYYKMGLNYNGSVINSYISEDGNYLFTADPMNIGSKVDGNFEKTNEPSVCQENGKPIVYFFGMTTCPHCQWEKPVIQAVAASFGDAIVYKEDITSGSGQAFANSSVFTKYSPQGSVPTIVLGCKYFRLGAGESYGEEQEKAYLTKLICDLTGNQPASVCATASK